jgi:hypothetical protein
MPILIASLFSAITSPFLIGYLLLLKFDNIGSETLLSGVPFLFLALLGWLKIVSILPKRLRR